MIWGASKDYTFVPKKHLPAKIAVLSSKPGTECFKHLEVCGIDILDFQKFVCLI